MRCESQATARAVSARPSVLLFGWVAFSPRSSASLQTRPPGRDLRRLVPLGVDSRRHRRRRSAPAGSRTAPTWNHAAPGTEKQHRLNHDNPCMQSPDEETLVERARRGDPDAFEALVVSYQSLAFRTAFVIAGDAADAEEAAQDAFVKAHRALGRFRSGEPFRPWLLTIVANEARNRRRTRGRRAALALRASEPGAPGEDPEAAALASERRERLLTAVERLRDDDRDVLACRYFLDLSEEETAAALGIARGTVKSRTHRALARLQEELQ